MTRFPYPPLLNLAYLTLPLKAALTGVVLVRCISSPLWNLPFRCLNLELILSITGITYLSLPSRYVIKTLSGGDLSL